MMGRGFLGPAFSVADEHFHYQPHYAAPQFFASPPPSAFAPPPPPQSEPKLSPPADDKHQARKRRAATVSPIPSDPSAKKARRLAATERERCRSQKINGGFERLRTVLPEVYQGRKLSKHETLMLAQVYINQLVEILQEEPSDDSK